MIGEAEIALNVPFLNGVLTYSIPPNLTDLAVGMRVEVPLQSRKLEGIIVSLRLGLSSGAGEKNILRQIDKRSVVNEEQIALAKWMSEYYLTSLGECLFKMLPDGKREKNVNLEGFFSNTELMQLNEEQDKAYNSIKSSLGKYSVNLLHGITGSGKTEVYIHLIDEVIRQSGKGVIFLVPEISLTVQMLKRLEKFFMQDLALLHSGLKLQERYTAYMGLLSGRKRVAVGTRSAIFAPVQNLGLIIIDEEHDGAYKEHSNPRYHTRQVASRRAEMNQALLLMGSATPSIEVYYQAKNNKINLYELNKRAGKGKIAQVHINEVYPGKKDVIGEDLLFRIKQRLDKQEQVILLLNRRGYSPFILSKSVNKFLECPNCTSNLCKHKNDRAICHLCGYKIKLDPNLEEYEFIGSGTQKLEETILEKFPNAKIERLDQDAAKNKKVVLEVIRDLIDKKIQILTGTQMIAKGLDIPNVTLVGVINAGIGLGLPDFRAGERVFSLLTQVAGRAGRSEKEGEAVIETYNKENPIIRLAASQDYKKFYQDEMKIRQDLYYPPFSRIVRIVSRSKKEDKSDKLINEVHAVLKTLPKEQELKEKIVMLGPVQCPFYKIDNNFRNHIIIKTSEMKNLKQFIKGKIAEIKVPSGAYMEIDFDPVDLV